MGSRTVPFIAAIIIDVVEVFLYHFFGLGAALGFLAYLVVYFAPWVK